MKIRMQSTVLIALCATIVSMTTSEALAGTRRATFPRYEKSYLVTSYIYIDTRQEPPGTFVAIAPGAPVNVPAAPGPPVVNVFCPVKAGGAVLMPNKIQIIVEWNEPDQPSIPVVFCANTAAQGGAFTWKWPCFRLDEFPATCCPEDPDNQSYFCCTDPEFELECDVTCLPEEGFPPSELFGDPDGADVEVGDIPTVSEWGLIVMALLLLTAGTIVFARRRRPAVA